MLKQSTQEDGIDGPTTDYLIVPEELESLVEPAVESVPQQDLTEHFDNQISEFNADVAHRKHLSAVILKAMTWSGLLVFGLIVFLLRNPQNVNWWCVGTLLLLQMAAPLLCTRLILNLSRPSSKQQDIIESLVNNRDPRVIAPLITGLATENRVVPRELMNAVTSIIVRLGPVDLASMSANDRQCLLGTIPFATTYVSSSESRDGWAELVVAVLRIAGEIGDRRTLEHVEKLAAGKAKADDTGRIQQAAIECLPALRIRVEQEQVRLQLLRPSASNNEADTLLMPSTEGHISDVDELPRLPL